MSCCDFDNDIYDNKIKKLENNLKNFEKEQNKTNAEIYTLLKQSGVDLSQYYALNEDDYTRTLTSDDDINTLEPGTYKIVKTDMPQNAPKGFAINPYDGTLIKSTDYMLVFEETGFHFCYAIQLSNGSVIWTWYDYAPYTIIQGLLASYMKLRSYNEFQYDDIHKLSGFAAGVHTVDSTVSNLPIQSAGILIIRQGINTTNNYIVTFLPQNTNDVYRCMKKTDGSWTEWERIAFISDIPSLAGYATQDWVNQQIQDITGGGVTADWVKNNYYPLTNSQYRIIPENTDYNTLAVGCYYGRSANFTNTTISSIGGYILLVKFNTTPTNTRSIIYSVTANQMYFCNSTATKIYRIAYITDIPSLSGYATQSWVQSQNYLTEIPDEYATDTEVSQAIATALVGYATQAWVNEQISEITGGAVTTDIVTQMISNAIAGYATQSWVNGRGYQTETQVASAITTALTNYTSKEYVKQNYLSIEKDLYESIPVNSDLNNYITKGNYGCFTGKNVPSIQNKPIGLTNAFKLVVEEIAETDQLIQKITENYSANMYYRAYRGGDWGNWIANGVISVFNTFKQLGITDLPCTTLDVYKAMPENSIAILGTDSKNGISDLPASSGVLEITKISSYRYKITFYKSSGANTPPSKDIWLATVDNGFTQLTWEKVALESDIPSLNNYASQEWVQQQGYQTVEQVNSLIDNATADMLTQEDLETFNYATENWVLQTALAGYAKTTIDDSLATRPSQEFDRFMIRSTDYHGVNAVSGAEGYLVMHMAVDPDSPTKFIRSSGIVVNNKYVNTFSTSDEASVGLSTNNEGTVTVVGMSNNAKQMFILVKPDNME